MTPNPQPSPLLRHLPLALQTPPSALLSAALIGMAGLGFGALALWLGGANWLALLLTAGGSTGLAAFVLTRQALPAVVPINEPPGANSAYAINEFVERILEVIPMPIYIKDKNSTILFVNKGQREQWGKASEELVGVRSYYLSKDPEVIARVVAEDTAVINGESFYKEEHKLHSGTGEEQFRIYTKQRCYDQHGEPLIICALFDTTSWRVAERTTQEILDREIELRRRVQNYMQRLINVIPQPVYVKDSESRYIFVNEVFATEMAMQPHEIVGKGPADLGFDEDRKQTTLQEDQAVLAGLLVNKEIAFPNLVTGEMMTYIITKGTCLDEEGRPVVVGANFNISALREAEESLRCHRDSLNEMIREQTIDLIKAKDAAESANIAKSQFLSNMSHELRTPMHAVLSFAKLGEDKADKADKAEYAALVQAAADPLQMPPLVPSKVRTYFQRIRESGDRLMHLLNNLLDLSKLEAGRMDLHLQRLNYDIIVRDALGEFEAALLAKQLQTTVLTNDCNTQVMADPTLMGQVVRNLLSNAIKFSPTGSCISFSFQAIQASAENSVEQLELVVADEGLGIPSDELDSVFDKFVQSSKTRSNAGGTGLGLPISREIVNAHRGQIFARNRSPDDAAKGTEFVVRIPRQPPQSNKEPAPDSNTGS